MDLISREAALDCFHDWIDRHGDVHTPDEMAEYIAIEALPFVESEKRTEERTETYACDLISRSVALDWLKNEWNGMVTSLFDGIKALPSAQPEIIRCKEYYYGEQDEVGRWFCRSLGCQIGNEDGSGYCADAERRTDGRD